MIGLRCRVACLAVIFLLLAYPPVCGRADSLPAPEMLTYRVIDSYPHDTGAYTQGLVVDQGIMYEGTGLNGRSTLRRVDIDSGRVLQVYSLPAQFFGEGITVWGDRLIQLTWKSGFGFVYSKTTFKLERVFTLQGEGWGLTSDARHLIVSDGTAVLRFLDPITFAEQKRITVLDGHGPVTMLNELEYIDGRIFANVYETDQIVIIDPESGRVSARADLAGLRRELPAGNQAEALNGIAYDALSGKLYVTGKLWPRLFHISLVPAGQQPGKNGR
jgi:glutaminyl-peptide cyclotransferase